MKDLVFFNRWRTVVLRSLLQLLSLLTYLLTCSYDISNAFSEAPGAWLFRSIINDFHFVWRRLRIASMKLEFSVPSMSTLCIRIALAHAISAVRIVRCLFVSRGRSSKRIYSHLEI
jgi:hypothetical protein